MQKFDQMQIFAHNSRENELCYHFTPFLCIQTRTYFPADAFTLPYFPVLQLYPLSPRTIFFTTRRDSHLTKECDGNALSGLSRQAANRNTML